MKLVGERRAIAALVFAFFFIQFLINALMNSGSPLERLLWGLCGVYGLAFFSLVAGYFWARWYATGVGLFGVIIGVIGIWVGRKDPNVEMWQVILQFALHFVATIVLWGEAMSSVYDGKTAWREKLHMDDNAVQRLGRSVIRAGLSLPIVVAYAFNPNRGAAGMVALGLAVVGFHALVKLRTWGILALGGAGAVMLTLGFEHVELVPTLGGALLLFSAAPFARPMLRLIRA
jgi:hypothetical protein